MNWREAVETVTFAGMLAAWPAWACLALLFHFGGHGAWRRSALGRNLMVLTLVIVWLLSVFLVRRLIDDFPIRRELVALGSIGVAVIGWHRVTLWLDEHRREDTGAGGKKDG